MNKNINLAMKFPNSIPSPNECRPIVGLDSWSADNSHFYDKIPLFVHTSTHSSNRLNSTTV